MKLDWKVTLIVIISLLCVVTIICFALANGHDGAMALSAISGFFGLAMYLLGHKGGKRKTEKARQKAEAYYKCLKDKEENNAVSE